MVFPRPLLQRLILSTAVMWLLTRILTTAVMWLYVRTAGISHEVGTFSPPEMMFVSLLVLLLIGVDIRASQERVLHANLGLSPFRVSSIVLSFALTLELLATVSVGPIIRGLVNQ